MYFTGHSAFPYKKVLSKRKKKEEIQTVDMSLVRLVFIVFIEQVTMNREGKNIMIYDRKCQLVCIEKYHFIFENIFTPLAISYFDFRMRCL